MVRWLGGWADGRCREGVEEYKACWDEAGAALRDELCFLWPGVGAWFGENYIEPASVAKRFCERKGADGRRGGKVYDNDGGYHGEWERWAEDTIGWAGW